MWNKINLNALNLVNTVYFQPLDIDKEPELVEPLLSDCVGRVKFWLDNVVL